MEDIEGRTDAEIFPPEIALHFINYDEEVCRIGKSLEYESSPGGSMNGTTLLGRSSNDVITGFVLGLC